MDAAAESPKFFRFGEYTLDLTRGTLANAAGDVPLRPKTFDVLCVLVEQHGRLVEKDYLIEAIWPRSTVTYDSLTQCIVEIRKALGDKERQLIKTIPRRGFLFDAPVTADDGDTVPAAEPARQASEMHRAWLVAIPALVVVGIVLYVAWPQLPSSIESEPPPSAAQTVAGERVAVEQGVSGETDAQRAFREGQALLSRRNAAALKGAVESFGEVVRLDPGFAPGWVGLADAYLLLTDYAEMPADEVLPQALAAAQQALMLDPDLGEAYASLGAIYNEAEIYDVALEAGESPEYYFRRAVELVPDYATAYQWYGEYLARTVGEEMAHGQYLVAASLDPDSPIINHMLASTYRAQGRVAEAEAHWRKAIEIDPGFSRGHQGLAVLYFRRAGRLADAAAAAQKAVRLNPSDTTNAALAASIHLSLGDYERARYWLDEGRKTREQAPMIQSTTALWLVMQGEDQLAAALLKDLYNTGPYNRFVFTLLRDHYIWQGDLQTALALCEASYPDVLALRPSVDFFEYQFVAVECGQVLKALGRHEEGDALINRARNLISPERIAGDNFQYVVLAMMHTADGEHDLAIRALREGVDAGWRYFTNYYLVHSPSLAALRHRAEFQALVDDYEALLADERRRLESGSAATSEGAASR